MSRSPFKSRTDPDTNCFQKQIHKQACVPCQPAQCLAPQSKPVYTPCARLHPVVTLFQTSLVPGAEHAATMSDWDSGWVFDESAYPSLPKSLIREAKKRRKFDLTVEEVVKIPGKQ